MLNDIRCKTKKLLIKWHWLSLQQNTMLPYQLLAVALITLLWKQHLPLRHVSSCCEREILALQRLWYWYCILISVYMLSILRNWWILFKILTYIRRIVRSVLWVGLTKLLYLVRTATSVLWWIWIGISNAICSALSKFLRGPDSKLHIILSPSYSPCKKIMIISCKIFVLCRRNKPIIYQDWRRKWRHPRMFHVSLIWLELRMREWNLHSTQPWETLLWQKTLIRYIMFAHKDWLSNDINSLA